MTASFSKGAPRSQAHSFRILLLTQHFWPEQFRINDFVGNLREAGAEVTVLTGQPNYPAGRTFDGYRWNGLQMEQHPSGFEIFRVPTFPRGKSGGFRLAVNYLSFIAAASCAGPYLLRRRRFDVVFVYATSPVFQALAALPLRRLKRVPVVLWVQDLWPHVLSATGHIRNPGALLLVGRAVVALYRRMDLILAQSEAFVDAIRPLSGLVPVTYFPNPGDPPARIKGDRSVRLPPGFNVVFAGNLGRAQALKTVVEAAELLCDEDNVRITLFGSGVMESWIRLQIEQRRLGNLVLGGRVPPEAMASIYSQSSAVLLTLVADEMLSKTIPSKLQSYLGAGVPIIAAAIGEPARIVKESGGGIVCAPECPAALASAIRQLRASSRQEMDAMRRRGQIYYNTHFEPRFLAARLLEQLTQLVNDRKRRGH